MKTDQITEAKEPLTQVPTLSHNANGGRIDWKALDQIRQLDQDGSAGILQKVLQIYLNESSGLVATIEGSIGEGDPEGLRIAAHSLKSSTAQVGVVTLSEFCKEMEAVGRRGSIDGAQAIFARTELEYEEVRRALSAELDQV